MVDGRPSDFRPGTKSELLSVVSGPAAGSYFRRAVSQGEESEATDAAPISWSVACLFVKNDKHGSGNPFFLESHFAGRSREAKPRARRCEAASKSRPESCVIPS